MLQYFIYNYKSALLFGLTSKGTQQQSSFTQEKAVARNKQNQSEKPNKELQI